MPDAFMTTLQNLLKGCQSIVDVGCDDGSRLMRLDVPVRIGLDDNRQVIDAAARLPWVRATGALLMVGFCDELIMMFPEKSVDAVMFYSTLEHKTRDYAEMVLKSAQLIARKVVIVWTPDAAMTGVDTRRDTLPLTYRQRHLFGWTESQLLDLDYTVLRYPNTHRIEGAALADSLLAWRVV